MHIFLKAVDKIQTDALHGELDQLLVPLGGIKISLQHDPEFWRRLMKLLINVGNVFHLFPIQ
jgi:hypothetical protein